MKKYRTHLVLAMVLLFIFGLTLRNFGLQLRGETFIPDVDLAAWEGTLFIIHDDVLKKLNSQLELVQAVRLPSILRPLPQEPNLNNPAAPDPGMNSDLRPQFQPGYGLPDAISANRLAVDRNYVYVLFEGTIFLFDHELFYIKSTPLD
jgi:hypothetical protein